MSAAVVARFRECVVLLISLAGACCSPSPGDAFRYSLDEVRTIAAEATAVMDSYCLSPVQVRERFIVRTESRKGDSLEIQATDPGSGEEFEFRFRHPDVSSPGSVKRTLADGIQWGVSYHRDPCVLHEASRVSGERVLLMTFHDNGQLEQFCCVHDRLTLIGSFYAFTPEGELREQDFWAEPKQIVFKKH